MKRGSGCCTVDIKCTAALTSFSNSIKLRNIFIFGMAYYVRHQLFDCTYSREDKIIDLFSIPPCRSFLRLDSLSANAVAKIWNDADQRTVHLPDLTLHRWNQDFRIRWFDDAFPQNVINILMDPTLI